MSNVEKVKSLGKKDNVVREKSFEFAVRIVRMQKHLVARKGEHVLSRQVLRSGTSIGANVEEADGAISKADFSNKISIAFKEARETLYWLRLLFAASYIDQRCFESMIHDCDQLCRILFAILKSTRINTKVSTHNVR
jgi:four helix bundle protein